MLTGRAWGKARSKSSASGLYKVMICISDLYLKVVIKRYEGEETLKSIDKQYWVPDDWTMSRMERRIRYGCMCAVVDRHQPMSSNRALQSCAVHLHHAYRMQEQQRCTPSRMCCWRPLPTYAASCARAKSTWPAVGMVDRRGLQKHTICDACGLCQGNQSILKVFRWFWRIHHACVSLRCLDLEIGNFHADDDRQNQLLTPCACVWGNKGWK